MAQFEDLFLVGNSILLLIFGGLIFSSHRAKRLEGEQTLLDFNLFVVFLELFVLLLIVFFKLNDVLVILIEEGPHLFEEFFKLKILVVDLILDNLAIVGLSA